MANGVCSLQLGHASSKISVDTYVHPRQGNNIALADRIDWIPQDARDKATPAQLMAPSVFNSLRSNKLRR
jgi:hypothetical protein